MSEFATAYRQLNAAQKSAVDTLYGPVLVIAGPGTGKTQLLSARVAHILKKTDARPQNILCLTFTESGAQNMRERLTRFIGSDAYDVAIGTYHAFGSTVIGRFPEYFTELRLERPVDELGKYQILAEILERVPYSSPMKQVRHHINDLVSTISEVKRGLLTADDLRQIATENLATIEATAPAIHDALEPHAKRLPSKLDVALPLFASIQETLQQSPTPAAKGAYAALATLATQALDTALETAEASGKTKPLTEWKNAWLTKDENNRYLLSGKLEARRVAALADVLEAYQLKLAERGLYDFDDMILRAVHALETEDELRYSLQEQYQFILLDEFQDTNAAQLKLVELLTNNPVHEGKPNVLAVGDDDQAIYAFQGAEASNMLDFFRLYRDVQVISLVDNYRSQPAIIDSAANLAGQIQTRLHTHFEGVEKRLIASAPADKTVLERHTYTSTVAEQVAVANRIDSLIKSGTKPSDIVVLAPKHKYLEPLVPYLQSHDIPVSYEKRENVLDAPVIRQLLTMSKLVLALHRNQLSKADSLWPEVLSYDFWDFSTSDIWQIAWQANDTHTHWTKLLLASSEFQHAALLFLTLASKVETETLEYMLDALIGTNDVQTRDRKLPSVRSPLRTYYFEQSGEGTLYETVTQLTVLRAKLRTHQLGEGRMLKLPELLEFVAAYESAEQQMLNTNPYNQAAEAVKLMTVFKAKGLEFAHVFMVACDDSVWGTRSSGSGNKLTLPANLAAIRHAGANDDERLRLLFVAMTRAKYGLHLSSHELSFSGKRTEPIKYFQELDDETGILPAKHRGIVRDDSQPPSLDALAMHWQTKHYALHPPLRELLAERLSRYQLSATHLTHFIDLKYGGPQSFLLGTLLRFPSAPTPETCFGNTIHDTLEWLQGEYTRTGTLPTAEAAVTRATHYLETQELTDEQKTQQAERAEHVLTTYLQRGPRYFKPGNIAEKSFRDEGVLLGDVHMDGKIDLLDIDHDAKRITVIDYKTGQLGSDPAKLHRYTLQLYCYKLLVEHSHSFAGYTVEQGKLLFVEPDTHGKIIEKTITFSDAELAHVKALLAAMWHHVQTLDMPDTSAYKDTLTDIRAFESALISSSKSDK